VSQTGDAVFALATAWLAKSLTGSDLATGFAVFVGAVPFLLFGPLAGVLVDRGDKKRILVASDVGRGVLLIAAPLLAFGAGPSFALVAGTAFLLACLSTPFLPARDALLPRLAEGRPLVRWNAAFQTSGQLATLLGLFLGGWLLGTERDDVPRVLWVVLGDGVTFLVSAVALAFLVVPPGPAPARARTSVWRDAAQGLRDAAGDPLLGGLLLLTALDNLAIMGPAIVGATLFVRDEMLLGPGSLAWFEGAMAGGFLVGALLLARFGTALPKGRLVLWGMLLDGLTYVPFFWIRSWPLALAAVFVHGLFIPWIVVGRTSLLQARVPEERAGRVFALVHLTVAGMTALSALASGAVAALIGPRGLFLAAGTFGAACGLAGFLAMPRLRAAR
jgi:DHA3 family macrolide efflux protein-like MFS transporter